VLFFIEEFDLFAMHPKQTLLYNLLDLIKAGETSVPIGIIALSSRWDVIEMLEKRVKSRFSNMQVLFHAPSSFSLFSFVLQRLFSLPNSHTNPIYTIEFNEIVEVRWPNPIYIDQEKIF
jgi:origin recognition complex subunit 4